MSVTPDDLLAEAKALAAAARASEARRRTVIGRAYYAAYHALLQAVQAKGYVYETKQKRPAGHHENLIHWCEHLQGDPDLKQSARRLLTMKKDRVSADYKLHVRLNYDLMQAVLEDAEALVSDLIPA